MGSEMCIRDRVVASPDRVTDVREPLLLGPAHTRTRSASAVEDTCLLYTSDAADERSSVDLGGRRIIKKKQTSAST